MLAKATQHDVTDVDVNGQHVFVGSSVTNDGVGAVLDRYEQHCRSNASQTAESWRALTPPDKKDGEEPPLARGTLRTGSDQREPSSASPRVRDRWRRSRRRSGRSAPLASSRGLATRGSSTRTARRRPATRPCSPLGPTSASTFSSSRTRMKRATHAGPTFRTSRACRNPVRAFSATATGTPYGVNVYRGAEAPAAVVAFYDNAMGDLGWQAIEVPSSELETSRLYAKEGVVLTLAASREDGSTLTGLGLAGASGDDCLR